VAEHRIALSLSRGAAGGASLEMTVHPHGFEKDRAVSGVRVITLVAMTRPRK
jgi:hypothetical protein